jgi:Domain of unknown function DUF11
MKREHRSFTKPGTTQPSETQTFRDARCGTGSRQSWKNKPLSPLAAIRLRLAWLARAGLGTRGRAMTGFLAVPFLALVLPAVAWGQVFSSTPEKFEVIDITPTSLSGEDVDNTEASLAVGTSANYGKFAAYAINWNLFYSPTNYYYTTAGASSFALPWTVPYSSAEWSASLDWSSAGTCYAAQELFSGGIGVAVSPDPTTGAPFSPIPAATMTFAPVHGPGRRIPSIRVVNVANEDHIFVGFNDTSLYPGATASVHYSLDGGASWNTTVIEKTTPAAGWDSPAVRLALSGDGKTVYGLFQRANILPLVTDFIGDVVLVRDDGYGGSGYAGLGTGTTVAHEIVIPWQSSLGVQRLSGYGCDVAIDPARPSQVYVAYTEMVNNTPILRVQSSADSGANFSLVYSIYDASLPALAVASGEGTVGLLYLRLNGNYLEVHFLKALGGSFASADIAERTLAKFPDNKPNYYPYSSYAGYLGDYFTLKAVNFNFFGAFCASGDPDTDDFPSGPPFYQRNVNVNGTVQNNFSLTSSGTLVDLTGRNTVSPSIDPFFFYDIAGSFRFADAYYWPQKFRNSGDPLSGIDHLVWPELPMNEPQYQLFTSSTLGPGATWTLFGSPSTIEANGQFESTFLGPQPQAFFRLQQNVAGSQFQLFAASGNHGSVDPAGVVTVPGTINFPFTAVASNNYAVSQWYLDGAAVQTGGSTLTVSNIATEHTLVVTFVASNDLAVTLADLPIIPGPAVPLQTNVYEINIENEGLNVLTGITMTNPLPGMTEFISAISSQGTVNISSPPGFVSANIGTLSPGASATVDITFVPLATGSITDVVSVACNQFEPDLSNNTATDVTAVIDPVTITNQPASLIVPLGGTAVFGVGASGTPPFLYQWFFNSNSIAGATGSTLTVTNVSAAQAGSYSVSVFQVVGGPNGTAEADSDAATLTIGSGNLTLQGNPGSVQTTHPTGLR